MAGLLTFEMQEFCAENPTLAAEAIARDMGARAYFGSYDFALYDQGRAKVINDRTNAPSAGVAATSTPINNDRKVMCNICNTDVNDFARHNRETHIIDPAKIFYCPYLGCNTKITRDGQITRDDHLAGSHIDFRNMAGRGGELLVRSDKATVLNKLTLNAARYVAEQRQSNVQQYENHRARLIHHLTKANVACPDLEAAAMPTALQQGAVNIRSLNKSQAITHAILVRQTLNAWDVLFTTAEGMLS